MKKNKKPKGGKPPANQSIISKSSNFLAKRLPSIEAVRIVGARAATHKLDAEAIARMCHVPLATAKRWQSGEDKIPYAASALLYGDLGAFSQSWLGWHVDGDALISPDGERITQESLLLIPMMREQIAALTDEVEKLRARIGEEQPTPPDELPTIHP
jgi:hypothetical protein